MKFACALVTCMIVTGTVFAKRHKSTYSHVPSVSTNGRSISHTTPAQDLIDIDAPHDEDNVELTVSSGDGSNVDGDLESSGDGDDTVEYSGGGENALTKCQLLRKKTSSKPSQPMIGTFVPRCTENGNFETMQCHSSTGHCWCVDPTNGREINGTRKRAPSRPSCDPSSSATSVAVKTVAATTTTTTLSTTSSPTSTAAIIVTEQRRVAVVTKSQPPTTRQAPSSRTSTTTMWRSTSSSVPLSSRSSTEHSSSILPSSTEFSEKIPDGPENVPGGPSITEPKRSRLRSSIIGQPGILAGIIGASVVSLLCLVLLIMFCVYRMHRKSQDPSIYYIDKVPRSTMSSSNKKAGYMKALDHDMYA